MNRAAKDLIGAGIVTALFGLVVLFMPGLTMVVFSYFVAASFVSRFGVCEHGRQRACGARPRRPAFLCL